jgi:hypothetical protein
MTAYAIKHAQDAYLNTPKELSQLWHNALMAMAFQHAHNPFLRRYFDSLQTSETFAKKDDAKYVRILYVIRSLIKFTGYQWPELSQLAIKEFLGNFLLYSIF